MKYKFMLVFIFLFCLMALGTTVHAENTVESDYIYDYWGNANKSISAFELSNILDGTNMGGIKLSSVTDVSVSEDKIFLVDSAESRINIFDRNMSFITSIKLIRDMDGNIVINKENNSQLMLTNPEGVYYSADRKELYIADTGAERIIVLDGQSYYFKKLIGKPKNLVGETEFKPSKIAVDRSGKIYIVVQGSHEGIIELNVDGSFSRYFGVNKPRVTIVDFFWKSIASTEQKEKMKKVFAPSFNNLDIDKDGFIYATTHDSSAANMVFRFNSKGENVLIEGGYFPVIGDLTTVEEEMSKFIDIAVSDYGVYALLDKSKGRVFIYNFEGELISVFNKMGNLKGNVKEPTAIAWFGDKLIITDQQLGNAFVFTPTEFGKNALDAAKHYFNGQWEEAGSLFEEILKLNGNYDIAYTGVGRNYLMRDEFKKAMYYFKLGNSRAYFSQAFNGYRNLFIQKNFPWFVAIFLIIAIALFYSEYRYNKANN